MKVWGLILGVAIIFGSVMNSEDAFAWKDKSKIGDGTGGKANQPASSSCSESCNNRHDDAMQRCGYIWNNARGDSTRGTNRCEENATVTAQSCERNCQDRH